jgi:hypothetical protein
MEVVMALQSEVPTDRKGTLARWCVRTIVFLLACLSGMTGTSIAQSNAASWSNLSALQSGQKITVREMNAKKHSGTFVAVTDAGLQLREASGDLTLARQDVGSVKLAAGRRRLRNTLIGLGVGGGIGAGVGAAAWASDTFIGGKGTGAAIGVAVGGVAGAAVGALWPDHKTIYKVAAR